MEWGILGLLVGDALGVPYEFTKPEKIPPLKEIEYTPPKGFKRAHNVPPGTWSDDGSQALCVLDAVLNAGKDETIEDAVGHRLLDWRDNGFMAVDGKVFDIGITTNSALLKIARGVPAAEAGMKGENTHANGSLMRTLPVALLGDQDQIVRAAMGQSRVTHAETIPMLCCALYGLWAHHLSENRLKAHQSWNLALDSLHRLVPKGLLSANIMLIEHWRGQPSGSGYCIDSLHSTKLALERGTDYESVVRHAIALGNDTDTTACIAGGLAGIKYQAIPQRWLDGLRGRDILDPLLKKLKTWSIKL
jgi:ADP-ribosylglycohydrolase